MKESQTNTNEKMGFGFEWSLASQLATKAVIHPTGICRWQTQGCQSWLPVLAYYGVYCAPVVQTDLKGNYTFIRLNKKEIKHTTWQLKIDAHEKIINGCLKNNSDILAFLQ